MIMFCVVADDITGAAEVAGICIRYGLQVQFGIDRIPEGQVPVKVIATNSRSEDLSGARAIHRKLARQMLAENPEFIFKKCDSALRGYILPELEELGTQANIQEIPLQPSNPASGRIIQNSTYSIQGVPLHETSFAEDPEFPAFTSEVRTLLDRNGPANQITANICDCTSTEELGIIAAGSKDNKLCAGSAAFFEQILQERFQHKIQMPAFRKHSLSTDFLMIVGSIHEASNRFISAHPEFPFYSMSSDEMNEETANLLQQQLYQIWRTQKSMILSFARNKLPDANKQKHKQKQKQKQKSNPADLILKSNELKTLYMTGGATAYSVLQYIGKNELKVTEELAPGVIRLSSDKYDIIIKPGSYAWPEGLFTGNKI